MRPDARVQAAIDVLGRWLNAEQPVERILADWGRSNRYAGSGDRRAIADLVYDAIRRKRSAAWLSGSEDARGVILGSLIANQSDAEALFSGSGHGAEKLSRTERQAVLAPAALTAAPWGVRVDLPDWLEPEVNGLDEAPLVQLKERAPLDLRVNRLKSDPDTALARLAEEDISARSGPLTPDCLRVVAGAHRIHRSKAYLDGLVEIQDAASQAGALFADVRPGETVLDFCAGGGGKTLALAAMQQGCGRLEAFDISSARLSQIPDRARRAGASVTLLNKDDLVAREGQFDCVFVDAPCSGSGAWRRTPEAKWRLTPEGLGELRDQQLRIMTSAMAYVAEEGRLIYATCSLFKSENGDQVRRFDSSDHRLSLQMSHSWTDLRDGDGFYAANLS
ncbi:MAG: RsmB/NOP family class I SAM-dependent RNA methyltransferase [Pseudomonadota bacterium]